MLAFLFDDRHRWTKFTVALAVLAALGVTCGLLMPVIRPGLFWWETRADEYHDREFTADYQRVDHVYADHFTVDVRRGAGLRFTDARLLTAATRPADGRSTDHVRVLKTVVRPGDVVSVRGVFRKPNMFIVTEIRRHPLRAYKFGTGLPAFLAVAGLALWRIRRTRGGLCLRGDGKEPEGDA